jgi:hypothetical protein
MLDIIDCAWAARRLKHPEGSVQELRRDWFANPSQSIARLPWGEAAKPFVRHRFRIPLNWIGCCSAMI